MKNIVIFASGSGSNAQKIAEYFAGRSDVKISLILSNKQDAYVLERAKILGIHSLTFSRSDFFESDKVLNILKDLQPDLLVLAGFLWLIPEKIIGAFPLKIINIHPALLPKYGGKGMYGMKVHQAVTESGETESGITIHNVNEHFDEGEILFQARCAIEPHEKPEIIAHKVQELEYRHFPRIIDELLTKP